MNYTNEEIKDFQEDMKKYIFNELIEDYKFVVMDCTGLEYSEITEDMAIKFMDNLENKLKEI